MKQELTIINPKEFGLEEKKGQELTVNLNPILKERDILAKQYDEIMTKEFTPELAKEARGVRLLIVKNRTQGTEKWFKVTAAFFTSGHKFCVAKKNMENSVNERMEENLLEIEKRQEREETEEAERILAIETERLGKLQTKRVSLISEYIEDAEERDLSSMDVDVWEAYLSTKKQAHLDFLQAELDAEKKRVAEAKAEKERLEAIEKENAKLKKEADERERLAKIESDKRAKEEEKRKAKDLELENQRKAAVEKSRIEKERLKKELQDRVDAEARAESNRLEAIQNELDKGDSEKVNDLKSDLEVLKTKYVFKSKKNKKMYSEIGILIDKTINHIK